MAERNYREILKEQFGLRCSRNPSYSLRAFARDLGLSPARLSEVFNEKQGLSVAWAIKIATRLGFTAQEKEVFCDLVEAQHGRSQIKKQLAKARLVQHPTRKYNDLQLDAFQVISDWYHFALLELTTIQGFKSETSWIAKKLGISQSSAKLAIERLIRLDLLERTTDGQLVAHEDFTASPDGIPSASLKKYHQQVLEKALSALYAQSVDARDITNVVFAFDRNKMGEAKKMIRDFRREFSKRLAPMNAKDAVYCLAIQFFQLDQNDSLKEEI